MMKYKVGPTGSLIEGHLFDVSKASFEDALKRIDRDLYLNWNPRKRRGLGCWEIRCRPDKIWVHQGDHEGTQIYALEGVENDLIHHVKDVPFLTYSALNLTPLRDRKNWVRDYEDKERKFIESKTKIIKEDLQYGLKQDRQVYKVFKDLVASGVNPALLAKYWGQSPN